MQLLPGDWQHTHTHSRPHAHVVCSHTVSSFKVFFASDNGAHSEGGHDHRFFDSTGGLRGYKRRHFRASVSLQSVLEEGVFQFRSGAACRSMFEGGVRSPTMVRWPDSASVKFRFRCERHEQDAVAAAGIPAGRVSDFAWAFWDVLPTIAEIAGASVPNGLDGISIVPELKGSFQKDHYHCITMHSGIITLESEQISNKSRELSCCPRRSMTICTSHGLARAARALAVALV